MDAALCFDLAWLLVLDLSFIWSWDLPVANVLYITYWTGEEKIVGTQRHYWTGLDLDRAIDCFHFIHSTRSYRKEKHHITSSSHHYTYIKGKEDHQIPRCRLVVWITVICWRYTRMERMEGWLSVVFQKHIVGVYVRKSKWFIKLLAGLGCFGFGNTQRSSSWTGSVCVEFGLGQERERNTLLSQTLRVSESYHVF